jgi:hypothetical protein
MKIDLLEVPVYYVNLDDQDEKREQTESLLKGMGFKYVERFSAIRHEAGRIIGCSRSHYALLSKGIKPPFIILEDDCALNKKFDSQFTIPDDADALYLGISHWGRYLNHSGPYVHFTEVDDQIIRVHNMLATHAIMYLTQEYVDICKRVAYHFGYETENHLDIGFAEIHKFYKVYCFDDPLFRQYEWSAVTSGKLSENAMNAKQAEMLYEKILTQDENYYKIPGTPFKSPIKELLTRCDLNGIPGYFLPTKLL